MSVDLYGHRLIFNILKAKQAVPLTIQTYKLPFQNTGIFKLKSLLLCIIRPNQDLFSYYPNSTQIQRP